MIVRIRYCTISQHHYDEVVKDRLPSLVQEYGDCALPGSYKSTEYPSMCGTGTVAIPGLEKIAGLTKLSSAPKKATKIFIVKDGTWLTSDIVRE